MVINMTVLYLVRHGKTFLNEKGYIQGWSDAPLTEEGKHQAKHAHDLLKDKNLKIGISSTSPRAIETLHLVLDDIEIEEHYDDLKEIYFGELDGKYETPELLKITLNPVGFKKYGGENHDEVFFRSRKCLEEICRKYPNEEIVIVSHCHVLCNLLKSLDETVKNSSLMPWEIIDNGYVMTVSYDGEFHLLESPH